MHPRPASLLSRNDQQKTWQTFRPDGASVGRRGRLGDLMAAAMERIVRSGRGGNVFEADLAAVSQRSIDAETTLRTALKPPSDTLFGSAPASGNYDANNDPKLRYVPDPAAPGATAFNALAQQLQVVARMVEASGNGGVGAHHLTMGGAVRGGDLYGNFPQLGPKNGSNNNVDSSPNQLANGKLLPEVAVDQFGATLARWFGATDTQRLDVFANLKNFTARDLGFMA